ncbi:MAG: hypothetical protein K0R65_1114 [Crocinitomicaceae bacterium]|jgi:hypothetical protein|nr:hypothetical protein [Crocinitomicaceae bacterium]
MKTLLYPVSFLCGMNLLAFELIGSKLLAPHFGTSFHVWSATLFVTLLGIALGYYFSGKQIKKQGRPLKSLAIALLVNVFILALVPLLSPFVLGEMVALPFIAGILLTVILFFFPVFFLLGSTSPLLIAGLENSSPEPAKIPGVVFSISTIGGVFGIYLFGFKLIPERGLEYAFYTVDAFNLLALILCLASSRLTPKTT